MDVFSGELIDLCEHDSLPPSRRCGVILTMRPQERRESGQTDLFRARLDQIVNLTHPLVTLARTIDWGFLEMDLHRFYGERFCSYPANLSN